MSNKRYLTARDFLIGTHKTGGLCRVCGKPAGKGRRTTCSAECAERMRVLCHISVQVSRVEKRDRGVCAICGWDTGKLRRILNASRCARSPRGYPQFHSERIVDRETARWLRAQIGNWATEIDHIVPVCEGGGVRPDMTVEQVLANLRTLCGDCHKAETRRLAARRAAARRDAKATLFQECTNAEANRDGATVGG